MSFPAAEGKYEERKEERKSEGPAASDIFIPRCPRLCIQQSQMQTAQIKSKQCKSRENSANQEKTVQAKSKQCKSNANDANQTQTAQIKNKQWDRAEIWLGQRQKDAAALSPDGSGAGPAGQRVHCPACFARQRPGSGTKTMGKERWL
jgi:hypothetical protein